MFLHKRIRAVMAAPTCYERLQSTPNGSPASGGVFWCALYTSLLRFDTILHYNKYKRLPRREKGTVDHDPSLILSRREVVSVMTWSEFFGFLAILIELFKFFFRVLRFVIKMSKKKSNRPGQR